MVSGAALEPIVEAYERDGFVNAGPILNAYEVRELADELDRYVAARFDGRDTGVTLPAFTGDISSTPGDHFYQFANLWQVSEPFRRLIANRELVERAVRLTGTTVLQVWVDTVQYKPPRNGGHFQWHQDAPYHASVTPPTSLFAAWIALDDADVDSGCMWMVPGSHRWGVMEPKLLEHKHLHELGEFEHLPGPEFSDQIAREWQGARPCPVRKGEVHFHHCLTWHGSPTNRSPSFRRAYSIHYMTAGVRRSTFDDQRIPIPPGALMVDAGSDFPVVYPAAE